MKAYEGAANCGVSILDQNDQPAESMALGNTFLLCGICRQISGGGEPAPGNGVLFCGRMQREGLAEARRRGGAYVYMCDAGLIYWISPIYSNGRCAGSLVAGGVIAIERRQAIEKLQALGGGEISAETAENYLKDIPQKKHEEIKALARILRLCAEQISDNTDDYGETVKQMVERESKLNTQIRLMKSPSPRGSDPVYPLDKERIFLAALRRGDHQMGRKLLNELLQIVLISNPGNFEFIRLRAIELVVLLSRAAVTPDATEDNSILEISSRCLKRIQESKNFEELTGNLYLVIERLAGQIFSFKGIRHSSVLRKAERYIWENYTRKISLHEVADISGLSAPYFSTIFKDEMGENFSAYLNRLRVEKAAAMMTETDLPLNEVAAACGFEDQSWFSKIFKSYTGISPGKYRDKGSGINSFGGEKEVIQCGS